jgi:phospholipid/cholesterol/gamma-HCH transport system permease protein
MILALQTGLELRRFGLQEVNIGTAVTVVMLREMGPFMTGLIIAASVGSAIAAQLGTMVVSEEVSALEIMSINPVRFLVMPRLLALAIMMPILTVYTNILGIVGGAVVGATQLGSRSRPISTMRGSTREQGPVRRPAQGLRLRHRDRHVACHQGFATTEGAVGVGQATRRTVIISFLTILILGYMLTRSFTDDDPIRPGDQTAGQPRRARRFEPRIERARRSSSVGPSGMGKSVTLKHMVRPADAGPGPGLDRTTTASARRAARNWRRSGPASACCSRAARCWQWLSAGENVALPLREQTQRPEAEIEALVRGSRMVAWRMRTTSIRPTCPAACASASALARAIITQPEIILYDEPTSGWTR